MSLTLLKFSLLSWFGFLNYCLVHKKNLLRLNKSEQQLSHSLKQKVAVNL